MSSFRARIIRSISSAYLRRVDIANVDVVKRRALWNRLAGLLPAASGVDIKSDCVHGLKSEWLTPKGHIKSKILLYLHGGGYVVGGCDMHRQLVSHIARAGRIQTLLPEYRLSPEAKYPAAIEDAVGVYRVLLSRGTRPEDIAIAGDSAGGGLTVATLLALREAGDPLPNCAVLLSPFLDVSASGESMQTRADQDPWFRAEDVAVIADHYCERQQWCDPLVSPVFADVSNLPPIYIQVGDDEILLSDSERLAENVKSAGGVCDLEVWPDMWHVFQMFIGKMPESRRAIERIGNYLQRRLA